MAKVKPDSILIEYKLTGECPIDIEKTILIWDNRWSISQYHQEFTLCHSNLKAGNFTKTDFKVRISAQQAKELISKLNLVQELSPVFRNGSSWLSNTPSPHTIT